MKLTVELYLKPDVAQVDIDQFFTWAQRIDSGPAVLQSATFGEQTLTRVGPVDFVAPAPAAAAPPLEVPTAVAPAGANPTWQAPAQGGLTHTEAAASASEDDGADEVGEPDTKPNAALPGAPVVPLPKKRGRKSTATRAAEIAAEAAAATAQANAPASPPPPAFGGALPPGIALPAGSPAVAPVTASVAPPPGAVAAAPPAVAMPVAAPPAATANGALTLEDFKREALDLHAAATGKGLATAYPLNRIRATTWLDGSPKGWHTLNMDAVPADDRQRILDECMNVLTRG